MKKLLLVGIATLIVSSASAAQPQTLPDAMTGRWCATLSVEHPPFVRGCDDGERLTVRLDGYEQQDGEDGPHAYCKILKVEKQAENLYTVQASCYLYDPDSEHQIETNEFELVGKDKLLITPVNL